MANEANTRARLIDKKLEESGWCKENWQIDREYAVRNGPITFDSMKKAKRSPSPKKADYLLRYSPSQPIAVIEAKADGRHHRDGERQAKEYAQKLGLFFAYSTNGHEIEFYDLGQGTQKTIANFHTPEELFTMHLNYSGLQKTDQNMKTLSHDYYTEHTSNARKPRSYQEHAINKVITSVLRGQKRILLTMATGTGKTFTALQIVYKLWKSDKVQKVLFIVDRNILADQAFSDFEVAMDQHACYRLTPRDKEFPQGRDFYFAIYQTLVGEGDEENPENSRDRFREFDKDYFDLIIIDEAHRGARRGENQNEASNWFRLLKYFSKAIQIGLTATPKHEETNSTYAHFGEPVFTYSLGDGIRDGFLAPYIIKQVKSNIDLSGYIPNENDRDVRGHKLPTDREFNETNFERELSIPQRTRSYAYHLIRHLFQTDPLGKTIVFCVNQKHALDMQKYCKEAFDKFLKKSSLLYEGNYSARITSDESEGGKYLDLDKFRDVKSTDPIVVTTSRLLTTGVDVKNIKNIVIFKNVNSMTEFKQIIGRGTRIYEHQNENKRKLGFFILEYANDSTRLFYEKDWDGDVKEWGGSIIDEGKITIPEKDDNKIISSDKEEGVLDSGILNLSKEGEQKVRFRMSEGFMDGEIHPQIEVTTLTDENGKPVSKDFILTQIRGNLGINNFNLLKKDWSSLAKRNQIMKDLSNQKFNVNHIRDYFNKNHSTNEKVDLLDIIGEIIFDIPHINKTERINKAKELNPDFFILENTQQQNFLNDVLNVYISSPDSSLNFSDDFWSLPQIQKHGRFSEIDGIFNNQLQNFTKQIQKIIYSDEQVNNYEI